MTREEAKSCICTIEVLGRLFYRVHGVMDDVDAQNCKKLIEMLYGICDSESELPSAHPDEIGIQLAYMRGKIDGIKECTEKLRKLREEFE